MKTQTIEPLKKIEKRIKGARLYHLQRANKHRLYIPYGKRRRGIKTSAWFEIVNDKLTPVVKVENDRHPDYFDDRMAEIYRKNIYKQFREIINDCELERKKVPLHERLKDDIIPVHEDSLKHQAEALRFCCSMKVSALFADTGTGKTKIALDLCMSRHEAGQINKVLIFCPVSTKKNFKNQIKLWINSTDIEFKLIGIESMSSSSKAFFQAYDFVDNDTQVIIDESHMCKNPIAKRSKRIKKCADKTSYKIVMTGTPVTEGVNNLYMQYAILSDLIIGVPNWLKFEEKYLILGGINGDEIIGYKNIDHLMGLLEPYTYQITKNECLDLPAKSYKNYECDFTDDQIIKYEYEKERLLNLIENEIVEATDIFDVFTRMQQIASGYYLNRNKERKREFLGTKKMELFEHIDLCIPTLIFCKYIFEIEMIIEFLGRDNCAIFTGKNRKYRDSEYDDFIAGNKKYFVATMQTGGTGLNGLIISNQIVFYSNSFSYFQRKQSIGRIDRQGQTKKMNIIDFCTRSGIDNRIMNSISRKSSLAAEIKELMKDKTKLKQYIKTM